jgi:hypothetical protein
LVAQWAEARLTRVRSPHYGLTWPDVLYLGQPVHALAAFRADPTGTALGVAAIKSAARKGLRTLCSFG